ncbi:hypothetical protein GS399_11645 [Pedobacter sp. HMF7647]|uniref:CPBP family intramembrane metalloprotease n=1 Tax=Hufsiella arboris TaxID=2695275 RepID=A0A7K1YAL1_9SPHI|nr:hypothetical protein [Hufsiella arboris]MXV51626.1 hypothetical protein [Hufsiella arboris]
MIYRDNSEQKSPAKRFLFILGLFTPLIYVVLGVTIVFFNGLKYLNVSLSRTNEILFGSFLLAYAVFRFVRVYLSLKNDKNI